MLKLTFYFCSILILSDTYAQNPDWIEGTWEVEFSMEGDDTVYLSTNRNLTIDYYFENFSTERSHFDTVMALASLEGIESIQLIFNANSFSFPDHEDLDSPNFGNYSIVNDTIFLDYKNEIDEQHVIPIPFYLINRKQKAIEFQWIEMTGDSFVRFMKKEE